MTWPYVGERRIQLAATSNNDSPYEEVELMGDGVGKRTNPQSEMDFYKPHCSVYQQTAQMSAGKFHFCNRHHRYTLTSNFGIMATFYFPNPKVGSKVLPGATRSVLESISIFHTPAHTEEGGNENTVEDISRHLYIH